MLVESLIGLQTALLQKITQHRIRNLAEGWVSRSGSLKEMDQMPAVRGAYWTLPGIWRAWIETGKTRGEVAAEQIGEFAGRAAGIVALQNK